MNLNKYRHKWENRMVAIAIIVAIVATIVIVVYGMMHADAPTWLQAIIIAAYASPIVGAIYIHFSYWKEIANAVEVTDKQYPELYKIFKQQVAKADLGFTPHLYVKNGNGTIDAYASKYTWQNKNGAYIVIFSDIVDTFYELKNSDTIRFVMSHELGHIKLRHVNVRRSVMQGILRPLFLHNTLSRAQEYSADRFGASITDKIAMPSLAILAAGKRNYENIDIDSYINNDATHGSKLWLAIANFQANHAIGRRRLAAAQRMDIEGWQDVHGRML